MLLRLRFNAERLGVRFELWILDEFGLFCATVEFGCVSGDADNHKLIGTAKDTSAPH